MGTSNAYGGPGNATPLIPSWLDTDSTPFADPADGGAAGLGQGQLEDPQTVPNGPSNAVPAIILPAIENRFTMARRNLSQFAASGGSDRASLGRAVSHYVSDASGGARQAARRMGSSRRTSRRLASFLSDAVARGVQEALRTLNLEGLVGHPVEEIFLGLADYVCPDGGTVDEGIARDAFIETIANLAGNGITDLNSLNSDQMQTVLELYASHAIEARLCNDVGTKTIVLPADIQAVQRVQSQLFDFIRRGVADALAVARKTVQALTIENVHKYVDQVYEQAWTVLQALGEAEAVAE